MIARLADHLAHFLTLASPVDRDARWDQARADVEAVRAELASAASAIVGDAEAAGFAREAEEARSFTRTALIRAIGRLLADRAARIAECARLRAALAADQTNAADAALERAAGLDERLRYPDKDRG